MSKLFIGCDPGSAEASPGGIAWVCGSEAYAEPLQTHDPVLVRDAINKVIEMLLPFPDGIAIEVVSSWAPGGRTIGASSAQRIGEMQTCPVTVAVCYGIPVVRVRPQEWRPLAFRGRKKAPKDPKEGKKAIYAAACQRWPKVFEKTSFTKWSGAADAIWIAEWLRQNQGG